MPYVPLSPCPHLGCPALVRGGGRCPAHVYRRTRGRALQRLRAAEVEGRLCARGCGRPATRLDHIVPLSQGGGDTRANRQPLCRFCHDAKTRSERR